MLNNTTTFTTIAGTILAFGMSVTNAEECPTTYNQLDSALTRSVKASGGPTNGGLDFHMWGTVVSIDGTVCAIAKSGDLLNYQWLGSRAISAQKASTAIFFSTPDLALSSANLYAPTQPGGSLFGLQLSNSVDPAVAYTGDSALYGTGNDPMVGLKPGGINVFGGGLALYDQNGTLVGAVGVSGDTSCADHNVATRVRNKLGLRNIPAGVNNGTDNIIYDAQAGNANGTLDGFEHPECGNNEVNVNNNNIQNFFLNNKVFEYSN